MRRRRLRWAWAAATAAGVIFGAALGTSSARADLSAATVDDFPSVASWRVIDLGTHQFGRLATPRTVVAHAPADAVTFERSGGATFGPWSFDVGRDGSVWLLDEAGDQVLTWQAGAPNRYRSISLGTTAAEDLAVSADGRLYVIFKPAGPDASTLRAFTPAGAPLWSSSLDALDRGQYGQRTFNTVLRFGPDGTLYEVGPYDRDDVWTALLTPSGTPVPAAQAWAGRLAAQPVTGSLMLWTQAASEHEYRLVLAERSGRVQHAWKLRSTHDLAPVLGSPATLLDDQLFVPVSLSTQSGDKFQYEWVMLRIPVSAGQGLQQIALSPRAAWGDVVSALRVGPDGATYQLRSAPQDGVSIARYTFAVSSPTPSPTSTASPSPPAPTTLTPTPTTASPSPTPATPTPTASTLAPAPPPDDSTPPWRSPIGLAVAVVASAAVLATGAWLWLRASGGRRPRNSSHFN